MFKCLSLSVCVCIFLLLVLALGDEKPPPGGRKDHMSDVQGVMISPAFVSDSGGE